MEENAPDDARPMGLGGEGGSVDAYEADWYRSLKALAARFETEEDEEEDASDEEAGSVDTATEVPDPEAAPGSKDDAPPAHGDDGAIAGPAEATAPDQGQDEAGTAPAPREEAAPREPTPITGPETEPPDAAGTSRIHEPEPVGPPQPSLDATDAELRRQALVDLAERGVAASDMERVLELTMDPNPDVRTEAVGALASQADLLPDAAVSRMLQDPNDQVRAQAVRLAAARGARELNHMLTFIGDRRAPLSQGAALEVLPELVSQEGGPSEEQLATALHTVARMDADPSETERAPLADLARGIGVQRLVDALVTTDDRRLGAVRLLKIEDSMAALRGLATLQGDALEEIRAAAEGAATRVVETERATEQPAQPDQAGAPSSRVEHAAESEMIAALAKTLEDTDEAVHQRATSALGEVDRSVIVSWVRDALRGDDAELARHAAGVAELRGLTETAPDLLDRGAATQGERQETYRRVLASLPIETEALVGGLVAVDPSRRPAAIRLLWQVAGRAGLPLLEQSLHDPNPDVRIAVLEVLALSDDPSTLVAAGRVLTSDSSPAVRSAAISVLGRGAGDQRLSSLAQALRDPDPAVRASAVATLPSGLSRDALELLTQALDDLDERVWRAALPHLASFPAEDLPVVWSALLRARADQREAMVAALEHTDASKLSDLALQHVQSPDPAEREVAIALAGKGRSDTCAEACMQALQDPVASIRRAAATALGNLRSPGAVQALGASLADPDAAVRIGAVRALGVIDSEAVLGFLVAALQDPSKDVRAEATAVLTEWSSPAVARRLAGVLATPALRDQAIDLLTKMGPSATELLVDVLLHSNAEMKPTVGRIIEQIVGPEHFAARLGSTDPAQRRRAMVVTGAIGGTRAAQFALDALADPDQGVRTSALEALAQLGDAANADAVARTAEADPVPAVAETAGRVLAILRPGGEPQRSA